MGACATGTEASTVGIAEGPPGAGSRAVSRSRIWCAAGRSAGSLASAASTTGRSAAGTACRSGWTCRMRYTTASVSPVPNGGWPLAA